MEIDVSGYTTDDPLYREPFVDVDEWRDDPILHRHVQGGFTGTDLRFSLYMPPPETYGGRFFQPLLPMAGTDHAMADGLLAGMGASLAFVFASGAYMVESNMGSFLPTPAGDATTLVRSNAAAAQFSRLVAVEMYGEHRPYGYVWGGSGGAFKSIACIENEPGVWDGAAPFVAGSPMSIPNVFAVQAHAFRVLRDHIPAIVDAVEPGGRGDMFAGLNVEQREALAEVTRFGFPPGAWFDVNRISATYTMLWTLFAETIRAMDPAYFDDFWTVPGYLGRDAPPSLLEALIDTTATVTAVVMPGDSDAAHLPESLARKVSAELAALPIAVRLDIPVDEVLRGIAFTPTDGNAAGRRLYVSDVVGDLVVIGYGGDTSGLTDVAPGDTVSLCNRDYLAFQTYHRHQYAKGYDAWRQYEVAGRPIHPQRDVVIGPVLAHFGSGALQSGRFTGKVILMEAMLDEAAYPWQADWYRQQVVAAIGDDADDRFRLWFVDHAMHGTPSPVVVAGDMARPSRLSRTIDYRGILEQALTYLVDWVERGVAPPPSTSYDIVDGQVVLPSTAAERLGVQSVVELTVNDSDRIEVGVGERVSLRAEATVAHGSGTIVAIEWDFEGDGIFAVVDDSIDGSATRVEVTGSFAYDEPGTWFPAVRVTSQRSAHFGTDHGRAQNLGRVRVVVHDPRSGVE